MRVALTGGHDRIGITEPFDAMVLEPPSSRAPRALRGDTLRSALVELGGKVEPVASRTPTERTLRSANPLAPPEPALDDDEPAPSALRPDQLAMWLQARG